MRVWHQYTNESMMHFTAGKAKLTSIFSLLFVIGAAGSVEEANYVQN